MGVLVGAVLVAMAGGPVFGWVNADIDGDGFVDLVDLGAMAQNWQGEGVLLPGNLNNDGLVDLTDFSSLSAGWMKEMRPLPVGVDLMETLGGGLDFMAEPIPAGFFGPGSDPFEGAVVLEGEPLGTFGPFEIGSADTIIHRTEHSLLRTAPDQVEIGIEIVELSLVSAAPIVVTYEDGAYEEWWEVSVNLVPTDPMMSNPGTMLIDQFDPVNGSCDLIVPVTVELQVTFVRPSPFTSVDMAVGPLTLHGSGSVVPAEFSPVAGLMVPYLETSFGMNIQLNSPQLQLDLVPAQPRTGPGPIIDPGAIVDPLVGSLARECHLYSGSFVGPGAVVGPYSQIMDNAQIGPDVLIAENVVIGQFVDVGPESMVLVGASVGDNSLITDNVIVGGGCSIGVGCVIEPGVEIGYGCVIGDNVMIGIGSRLGTNVEVGDGAVIEPGMTLMSDAVVVAGGVVSEGLFKCSEPLGGNYVGTAGDCETAGGAVSCWGDDIYANQLSSSKPQDIQPGSVVPETVDPCDPCTPDWVKEAVKDLNKNKYHDPCASDLPDACESVPIPDREYDDPCYTCGDFAHDAERGLSGIPDPCNPGEKKYKDVTITYYWKYKPNPAYNAALGDKAGNRKWLSDGAHALIDIHKDGKMVWIEPQTGKAPNPPLDFDGDGKVEYWDNPDEHKPFPPPDSVMSDDHVKIEVYPDRKTAEAAGAPTG